MDKHDYTYKHPHPAVTVDIVLFTIRDDILNILLIQRGVEPFKNKWALPGGFVRIDEDLDTAARRELHEETSLTDVFLDQLGAWGNPARDPRERVISIAYFAIVPSQKLELSAGTDARLARWYAYKKLPELAFDHKDITDTAYQSLLDKIKRTNVVLQFLPNEFTLTELQKIHEIIMGEKIDKRNFRKWVDTLDYIQPTGKKQTGTSHRPAALYTSVKTDAVRPGIIRPHAQNSGQIMDDELRHVIYKQGYNAGLQELLDQLQTLLKRSMK